ncbi:MAG: ATP-binding protein [Verrucomicrobia bacterium]|nr:ATP-binding protein [Verrucomicrobiota bacterium]
MVFEKHVNSIIRNEIWLLCIVSRGSGKSIIAKWIPSIHPALTLREAIETAKLHNSCGSLNGQHRFVATR